MKSVELLLPAGNTESFYAALEGGANAVYLGLKHFNARERADNFKYEQIPVLIEQAHKQNCKVYITLNTVIKNSELDQLFDLLDFLNKVKPDAIIIQDWGVYYLVKSHFTDLVIHASTQMANHNSLGAKYSENKGFERIILARELTLKEIKEINQKFDIESEVFIHGALCYSFSGMCHFSSFLGGHGANRGLCTQVCRRSFDTGIKDKYFFSLKDNEQIENIQRLIDAGVDSLKIEGRLKSADYVYKVARAYRMVIDDQNNLAGAKELLKTETGRAKTEYFLGSDLSDAITYKSPNTGLYLGKIIKVGRAGFVFETKFRLEYDFRVRIKHPLKDEQQNLKVKDFEVIPGNRIKVFTNGEFIKGSDVFLSGITERKFSSKLPEVKSNIQFGLSKQQKKKIIERFKTEQKKKSFSLFVRIDSFNWMKKIRFDQTDNIILSFNKNDLEKLDPTSNFLQKFKQKIWIEFPHFISEENIDFYKKIAKKFDALGLNKFFLSHLSQKLLIPAKSLFACNENVYAFNDAAADFFISEGAKLFTYPVENDSDNYKAYHNKNGIVPVFLYPKLFISRMPVKIKTEESFKDDLKNVYHMHINDGITFTVPEHPVSFLQYVGQFKQQGFSNFLIDFSFENPSSNRFATILKRFKSSQQIQPSYNFNYKRALK